MSFLRRVVRGPGTGGPPADPAAAQGDGVPGETVEDDAERDRELVREDAERLADELVARQHRYADRKWAPPSQGGARRADDAEAKADGQA